MKTIIIAANEIAPGMTLNYPMWHENRPADRPGNVWNEPLLVKALDDSYADNRVLWFEAPGTSAVIGREARLELVVPERLHDAVDALTELGEQIAAKDLEGDALKETALNLAKVRGAILSRAAG